MAIERNLIRQKSDWAEDSKPLPNLPYEINVEILLRLPVKSLLRFRCVSKSWCSSISDTKFAKTHLRLASSNTSYIHHRLLLITNDPLRDIKSCSISSIMRHEQSDTAVGVDYPFVPRFWIDDFCDGLVCIHTDRKTIFLWNPSTKKSRKLPNITIPDDWPPACGLGYDTSTDDYKVVLVFNGESNRGYHQNKMAVYTLRADSWRRIADCPHSISMAGKGKFVSGALHWTVSGRSSELIVSLDLAKETYGEVSQPDYNGDDGFLLIMDVLSGYLCMLCRQWQYDGAHVDHLWVMKEYGIRESWTKLVAIHDVTHPLYGEYLTPKCILNNGDVLMVVGMYLVRYNPNDGTFSYPKIHGFSPTCSVYPYIESLVSP